MIVLSHRGYWKTKAEKNLEVAFHRSFKLGFGTETDIRDFDGKLVISHDPASQTSLPFDSFLEIYKSYSTEPTLALNVKADGLQEMLMSSLKKYAVENYFAFDMSVPDALVTLRAGLKAYTRQSEYETSPSFYEHASGIWLDEFQSHWVDEEVIRKHFDKDKSVCIVSPELHSRDYKSEWEDYKEIERRIGKELTICTDLPEEAEEFFNG